MHSMAIKINVSHTDQDALNKILVDCGYAPQKRKFHCTFGFIEKMIPEEEANSFGLTITQLLQDFIDPLSPVYEVERASHLFRHVIAFEPTQKSLVQLQEINGWLKEKVIEISEGRFELNKETQSENYTPHLTLLRTRKPDSRFKRLESVAEAHPAFALTQAGYVIF